ncbi:hypothetical protein [Brucella intermedia]|uniref:hypothetical protein n=1 Tax=Brucella intermedia TaxID=94625 RepID=UPI0021C653BA|nr:hypothetical protein [Brucella intermedia]UXO85622.1 hypothetical protein N8I72_14760 [Brucella intermedia]
MTSDLITRLSKLDAPDREVDALIVAELEPHIFDAPGFTPIRPITSFHIDPQGDAIRFDGGGIMCLSYFPLYTASVDAVIALAERVLPESVARRLIIFNSSPAKAGFDGTPERGKLFYYEAATPAIALCLALLRAKEASK